MRGIMIALLPLILTACAETAGTAPSPDENLGLTGLPVSEEVAEGRKIAGTQCAGCHGLDEADAPRSDAPALRHILSDYDPEALGEDFRDGIKVGHPDMPEFHFGPMGTDMLLSYLESIQEPLSAD
jgi:mono/diheme cytochrome c family protein